jgi:FkbM family methyltransferase
MMLLNLKGATVIDIGANRGIYCFWMVRAVGSSGRVIAFEPQPEMRDTIARLKARFGWDNLRVVNAGLSNADGCVVLARQRVGDGSASIEPSRRNKSDETIRIEVSKLDAFAADIGPALKFIKCDVEGHERDVFLGGEETIRRYRPVVQFESTVTDARTEEIFEFFRRLGYSGVLLLGEKYLAYPRYRTVPHYKFGLGGHRDFLFFPPEAIGSTIPQSIAMQFPESALRFPVPDDFADVARQSPD